jgi:protein-disulfide isomerase|tara:strand:- start:133 stop:726 length:594 start_codon:yes stop_codon:yes gene_type:complete
MTRVKLILIIIPIFFQLFISSIVFSDVLKIGNENAKITIKVFSSLTCPHCASFHKKIFEDLKKNYIDKNLVKFEHHAFPLDLAALNAEKIVRCASSPDARFKLLTKIYAKQTKWAVGSDIKKIDKFLIKIGTESKISESNLRKCLDDEKTQELILKERIQAQKEYNIKSTPTIYINDKKYEDKHEFKSFKKQIDKLL